MFDVITLGSATLDVFIKSQPESLKHKDHVDICYHKGEKILIDKIYYTIGGGGTNTATAFSRLGLKTGFIGIFGTDISGEIIKRELQKENVDFLGKEKIGNSGYSLIILSRSDRTILAYKGVNNQLKWRDIPFQRLKSSWIYISTMLGESFKTAERLTLYAKENKIKVAANISSYEASRGIKKLSRLLENTDILILNKEEAEILCKTKNIRESCYKLMQKIRHLVVITNGSNPVHICTKNNSYIFDINKIKNPIDITGAGDAFASGFLYGIIRNKNIQTAVKCGEEEARAVIMKIGAKSALLREFKCL